MRFIISSYGNDFFKDIKLNALSEELEKRKNINPHSIVAYFVLSITTSI